MSETTNFKEKFNDKILEVLSNTIDERKNAYLNNQVTDIPKDVKDIFKKTANRNAIITGASSIIPGPFGMALAIPEIALITKNQINMIYDIGKSLGKEKSLSKELILGILLATTGSTTIGLLTVQGTKILVKRTSLKAFQKVAQLFGVKVLQQSAKSMIGKWIPGLGAAALAAWTRYTTIEIGKYAVSVFNKDIEESMEVIEDVKTEEESIQNKFESSFHLEKMKVLINLLKIDRHIDDKEVKFMEDFIGKSDIDSNEKASLIENLTKDKTYDVDFGFLKNSLMESTGMIMDMIALIQTDDKLHFSEKIYFKKIAEEIGIEKEEIEELLTELK